MNQLYHAVISDHFRNPRHSQSIDNPDVVFDLSNPLCGDVVRVELKFNNNGIQLISLQARGCVISVASASLLAECIITKEIATICQMDKNIILNLIKIPLGPTRLKCALLCLEAVQESIKKYQNSH